MRKILTTLLAISSILLLFSSCKKDETKVYSSVGSAGTLTASSTSPALTQATSTSTAVTFSLSAATPVTGYQTGVTYTIQIGKKGSNFVAAQEISAAPGNTSVTVGDLNTMLSSLGLTTGVSTQVEVRVKSTIAANVDPAYSNTINLTVTPYAVLYYVYVPGGYQGWTPATAPSLSSTTSNGVYTGTVIVPAGTTDLGFKITPAQNWDTSYGGANGVLSTSGANLAFPSAGTFTITVDMTKLTYTITKQ
ncbi:DUF5116 domain-containing protein [Mucilaginibacter robiniae]|uniref:DUF5116 domain-containing protein n=1 Tax=Mucilaginibacter robiniae TaxID=2728022 RepID=A0A7L5E0K0_9SPHI|nr:SusE domain-containing protein [Mucilaginibacter robiniae]QJD95064.1 DUF5116 domain-containing protein [Mucilaginibacter robiniae]